MNDYSRASFLIAGLGSVGQRHLRNLLSLGFPDVALLRTGKGTLDGDWLKTFDFEDSIERALDKSPSAVIVANPTSLHLDIAIPAAKAGCHLLLEKPISHSMARIDELREAVGRNRVKLMVGFQFRFHPTLRKIKTWISEGDIGSVISAHVHWGEYLPDWHPWEDYRKSYSSREELGGGVALTLCHPIDYLQWLLGKVITVYADMDRRSSLATDTEDQAVFILRFSSGVVATVCLDFLRRPPIHELTIVGERGSISWSINDNRATLHSVSEQTNKIDAHTATPPAGFERNSLFVYEMSHFVDCVINGATPISSLDDGIRTLKVVLAGKQSSIERREIHVE